MYDFYTYVTLLALDHYILFYIYFILIMCINELIVLWCLLIEIFESNCLYSSINLCLTPLYLH